MNYLCVNESGHLEIWMYDGSPEDCLGIKHGWILVGEILKPDRTKENEYRAFYWTTDRTVLQIITKHKREVIEEWIEDEDRI